MKTVDAVTKKALRKQGRDRDLAALRDGRKVRATTFTDRKREASRKACRRGQW